MDGCSHISLMPFFSYWALCCCNLWISPVWGLIKSISIQIPHWTLNMILKQFKELKSMWTEAHHCLYSTNFFFLRFLLECFISLGKERDITLQKSSQYNAALFRLNINNMLFSIQLQPLLGQFSDATIIMCKHNTNVVNINQQTAYLHLYRYTINCTVR